MKKVVVALMLMSLLAIGCSKPVVVDTNSENSNVNDSINTDLNLNNSTIPKQKETQNQTVTWKTYTAPTMKYKFQYPSNWYFDRQEEEQNPHLSNMKIEDRVQEGQVSVEIQANNRKDSSLDLMTAFKQYTGYVAEGNCLCSSGKITQTTINGHKAIEVERAGGEGPTGPGYFIERDSTRFFYILVYGTSDKVTVDRIINSIEFTN